MFRVKIFAVILVLSALLFSCSGKDGATGPAGKNGTNGQDGNANVIVFEYGTRTTTSGMLSYSFTATQGLVDSSLVLGYYVNATFPDWWYPVPGLGTSGLFTTRSYWLADTGTPGQFKYWLNLLTPNGSSDYTTSTTFTKFKIILVPASLVIPVTSRGMLNLSDYNAVSEYLNLSE